MNETFELSADWFHFWFKKTHCHKMCISQLTLRVNLKRSYPKVLFSLCSWNDVNWSINTLGNWIVYSCCVMCVPRYLKCTTDMDHTSFNTVSNTNQSLFANQLNIFCSILIRYAEYSVIPTAWYSYIFSQNLRSSFV